MKTEMIFTKNLSEDVSKGSSIPWNLVLRKLREGLSEKEIIAFFRENHVPFLWPYTSAYRKEDAALFSTALDEEFENQRAVFQKTRSEFQVVLNELKTAAIEHIFIKSAGLPPSFPWESDNLDVLFREKDVPVIKEILVDVGYIQLKQIKEKYKTLFRKFQTGKSVCAIHVHTNVGWEGVPFIDLAHLWENKRRPADDPDIAIPAPEDSFLINIAHALYENRMFRFADFIRFYHLVKSHTLDWDVIFSIADRRGWLHSLTAAVRISARYSALLFGDDLREQPVKKRVENVALKTYLEDELKSLSNGNSLTDFPVRFSFKTNFKLWYSKIFSDSIIPFPEKIKQASASSVRTLKRKITGYRRIQPAYYIGISGIDGSGKTTQTRLLQEVFTISEIYTRTVWIRGSLLKTVDFIRGLVGKKVFVKEKHVPDADISNEDVRKNILNNIFLSFFYKGIIMLELITKFNLKIRLPLVLRKVVLSDRTIYDAIADMGVRFGTPDIFDTFFAKMILAFSPKPSISFLLVADKNSVLKRKTDESDLRKLEAKLMLYEKLAARYAFIKLHTDRPLEQNHQAIIKHSFDAYYKKYDTPFYTMINPG